MNDERELISPVGGGDVRKCSEKVIACAKTPRRGGSCIEGPEARKRGEREGKNILPSTVFGVQTHGKPTF